MNDVLPRFVYASLHPIPSRRFLDLQEKNFKRNSAHSFAFHLPPSVSSQTFSLRSPPPLFSFGIDVSLRFARSCGSKRISCLIRACSSDRSYLEVSRMIGEIRGNVVLGKKNFYRIFRYISEMLRTSRSDERIEMN